jgi:UPF0755 protein
MSSYYHGKYGYHARKKKKRRFFFILLIIILFIVIIPLTTTAYFAFRAFFKPNVWIKDGSPTSVYIPTNASFDDLKTMLYSKGMIIHRRTFEWLAHFKGYDQHVKPGRYIVYPGMSNNELVRMLNAGEQTPVKVIINNIRTKEELAGHISKQIEADSLSLIQLMNSGEYIKNFGFTNQNILMMFIPNTYEFYWNTTASKFMERMDNEYSIFWNSDRQAKLNQTGLSREEVTILASIIEKETNKNDEKPRIAGVYINRLRKGWLLQADPTVVYALGDFSIQRVLKSHKEIVSPYNTYKIAGLPPGPICLPSIVSIDAVLNFEKHNYFYFCARDDFSGYHDFSSSYSQHFINAQRYQKALDRMDIKR